MQVNRPFCRICNPNNAPNTVVCNGCIDGGYGVVSFVKELKPSSTVDLSTALQWMKEMKGWKEKEEEKMAFLGSMVVFKEGIHTDILLQPGTGPAVSSHRALLASKSEIFRTMLSNDECKASAEGIIRFPDLTHDDLRSLVDFLYSGNLPARENLTSSNIIDERFVSLLIAADKYEIHYLKNVCELRIIQSLTPGNALGVLELAFRCSSARLMEQALNVIVKNADAVLLSTEYDAVLLSTEYDTFAAKNVHLCVEITRAMLKMVKKA